MSDMMNVLDEEFKVIKSRQNDMREGSYTCYLFKKGLNKILKKISEEAGEVIIAAKDGNKNEVIGEICDLLFHSEVMMAQMGISWEDITLELKRRRKEENMQIEKDAKRKAENRTDETVIN